MRLDGKRVLLGVSGGIAAYKAVEVLRVLKKAGADVTVMMTAAATQFVTPLTFETLSGNPVSSTLFDPTAPGRIEHITLSEWPDLILIAPATANVIGKIASGIADDLLTTTVIATAAPVLLAPAMHSNMLSNPIVAENMKRLESLGYVMIGPEAGELASGGTGTGRLAGPEAILGAVCSALGAVRDLEGVRVAVTSGRTEEDIDPVRFITNRSTGRMGHAVAERAGARGAEVHLITGPSYLAPPPLVQCHRVRSAQEMHSAVMRVLDDCDLLIMAAAVSDFRPLKQSSRKVKKSEKEATVLRLVANPDIAADAGKNKGRRVHVGFALETEDDIANAAEKLARKNLDFIVVNNPLTDGAAFAHDTNVVTIVWPDGRTEPIPKMTKRQLADLILDRAMPLLERHRRQAGQDPPPP